VLDDLIINIHVNWDWNLVLKTMFKLIFKSIIRIVFIWKRNFEIVLPLKQLCFTKEMLSVFLFLCWLIINVNLIQMMLQVLGSWGHYLLAYAVVSLVDWINNEFSYSSTNVIIILLVSLHTSLWHTIGCPAAFSVGSSVLTIHLSCWYTVAWKGCGLAYSCEVWADFLVPWRVSPLVLRWSEAANHWHLWLAAHFGLD